MLYLSARYCRDPDLIAALAEAQGSPLFERLFDALGGAETFWMFCDLRVRPIG
jgi:hypothetical protein